jgi:hypothetical protein
MNEKSKKKGKEIKSSKRKNIKNTLIDFLKQRPRKDPTMKKMILNIELVNEKIKKQKPR